MNNVLISLPGISFDAALSGFFSDMADFMEIGSFEPTLRTLDVYSLETKDLKIDDFWGINIPHRPLEMTSTQGLAGPGLPGDELLYPKTLEDEVLPLLGQYDKWRPYPAEGKDDEYSKKIARRFAVKRGKVFEFIVRWTGWDTIMYVDHSTAAVSSVDMQCGMEIAENIVKKGMRSIRHRPKATCVIFSPYGPGGQPGFVVSNKLPVSQLGNWEGIRKFLRNEKFQIDPKKEADPLI